MAGREGPFYTVPPPESLRVSPNNTPNSNAPEPQQVRVSVGLTARARDGGGGRGCEPRPPRERLAFVGQQFFYLPVRLQVSALLSFFFFFNSTLLKYLP